LLAVVVSEDMGYIVWEWVCWSR